MKHIKRVEDVINGAPAENSMVCVCVLNHFNKRQMQLKPIGRERTHLINDSYGKNLTACIYFVFRIQKVTLIQKKAHCKQVFKGVKMGVEATGFLLLIIIIIIAKKKLHLRRLNWKTPMTPIR